MYAQLLIDLFRFLAPFLRNAELTKPTQLLYKVGNGVGGGGVDLGGWGTGGWIGFPRGTVDRGGVESEVTKVNYETDSIADFRCVCVIDIVTTGAQGR